MNDKKEFKFICRMINEIIDQRDSQPVEISLEQGEASILLSYLEHYRRVVNPSSGDVLIRTEYTCPGCGSKEQFRGQDSQVSKEAEHLKINVEVIKVQGISQCSDCGLNIRLNKFEPVKLDEFDEDAWQELYGEEYRERERVEKLQPQQ